MLNIRANQMAALNLDGLLRNSATIVEHGNRFHSARCEALGRGALEEFVRDVITRGASYGIDTMQDMLAFFDLAMVFGLDWSTAETRWLHNGMSDRTYTDMTGRLKGLRRKAIYRLEAAALEPARAL